MVRVFKSLAEDGTKYLLADKNECQVLKNTLHDSTVAGCLFSDTEKVIFILMSDTSEGINDLYKNEAAQILLNDEIPLDGFFHFDDMRSVRSRNPAAKLNKFSLRQLHPIPRKNKNCYEALLHTMQISVLVSSFNKNPQERKFSLDLVNEKYSTYSASSKTRSKKRRLQDPNDVDSDEAEIQTKPEDLPSTSTSTQPSPFDFTTKNRMSSKTHESQQIDVTESDEPDSGDDSEMEDEVTVTYEVLPEGKVGDSTRKRSKKKEERELIALGRAVKAMAAGRGSMQSLRGQSVEHSGVKLLQHCLARSRELKMELGENSKGTIFDNPIEFTEYMIGVGKTAIRKIRDDPPEGIQKRAISRKNRWKKRAEKIPEFMKEAIRDWLDTCWEKNKHVTVSTLLDWLKNVFHFQLGRSFLNDALHGMGLTWRKKSGQPLIQERIDLIVARKRYLERKLKLLKREGKQVFFGYLDETWFFEGMSTMKGWEHKDSNMYKLAREVRIEERRSGPPKGKDKGRRAIVLGVLTSEGILKGSENILISGLKEKDQLMDFHKEMNFESYMEYMELVLPLMAEEARKRDMVAALVVDNAPYHCEVVEKIPTKSSSKTVIKEYLETHNVPFDQKSLKKDLVVILEDFLRQNGGRQAMKKYVVDEEAKKLGVEILRLPPYHCQYNPIELTWAALKTYLRQKYEEGDTLKDTRQLALDWMRAYSPQEAQACIRHVEELEEATRAKINEREIQEELDRERIRDQERVDGLNEEDYNVEEDDNVEEYDEEYIDEENVYDSFDDSLLGDAESDYEKLYSD
ncbi:unnamed protein product [Caenorhabditis angaria]|uniref:Tc1-like transposase DDE domain-containing protein n=1 Tax=Caenorhabditis angaria TaxID=860376 RepID=A0A9P1IYS6_9PELO|nr:unnamed protein product [Caenorhabditis angaria]